MWMRFVTVRFGGATKAGRVEGSDVVLLDAPDVGTLLAAGADAIAETGDRVALDAADLAPPVLAPQKIVCVGLNYRNHILETGRELPTDPTLFVKFPGTLIGPTDPIVLPRVSQQVDWEGELAFVVGRRVRNVSGDAARDAIAGYTIANDISARDWQYKTSSWIPGKVFEATCPMGPAVVTPDELGGGDDLLLRCEVDGAVMQEARTSELVFPPTVLVEFVSTLVTLEPGDVFLTGTPGGVGVARTPAVFLAPGQVVRTTIEGIGEMVNECVEDKA
jgi:acylpyruvate hydrolase